jgi:CO/xanthine dehydrogenase FAD-binding subunit
VVLKINIAESLREAIFMLSENGEKSRIVAGGTDLLMKMKKGVLLPEVLIDIKRVKDLNYVIRNETGGLRIGAVTSISTLADSPLVQEKFAVLGQATSLLGTPTIRRQATIGGNLCNAAPSADTAPALIVLGARLAIITADGESIIPVEDFFTAPGETVLRYNQILTEIQIPDIPPHSGAVYLKQSRVRGADLTIAGVAALVTVEDDVLKDVKIAMGAVAPTPIRAYRAESTIKGKKLDDTLLEESGRAASNESRPIDDARASADYRKKLVSVLVKRAIKHAIEQAKVEK